MLVTSCMRELWRRLAPPELRPPPSTVPKEPHVLSLTTTHTILQHNPLNNPIFIHNHTTHKMSTPSEPPPSYSAAIKPAGGPTSNAHLSVPEPQNGIPPYDRRSMEDETRSLPHGWVREYDHQSHHQFFVNTLATPPRSIWHHPYDDDEYLSTLSQAERERVKNLHSSEDEGGEYGVNDGHHHAPASGSSSSHPELPPRQEGQAEKPSLGRKLKDKLTSSTHEEREADRRARAEQERKAYEQHLHVRRQMSKAMETGQPQLLGKDRNGKDVYIEPPQGPGGFGYPGGGYGYNPYANGPYGPYGGMNRGYGRPMGPYGRPYGGGYGGGMGMGMPLLGGLAGGALLGGLLF